MPPRSILDVHMASAAEPIGRAEDTKFTVPPPIGYSSGCMGVHRTTQWIGVEHSDSNGREWHKDGPQMLLDPQMYGCYTATMAQAQAPPSLAFRKFLLSEPWFCSTICCSILLVHSTCFHGKQITKPHSNIIAGGVALAPTGAFYVPGYLPYPPHPGAGSIQEGSPPAVLGMYPPTFVPYQVEQPILSMYAPINLGGNMTCDKKASHSKYKSALECLRQM